MKPSQIQAAIVASLAARYPAFTVDGHGGTFTEREVPLLLAKAPALLVACTGGKSFTAAGPGRWKGALNWALYVFGADSATTERDVLALDTVFDLTVWLPEQKWGIADARLLDPTSLTADNLYSGQVNILRVAVWGLTWTQSFYFTP